MPQGANGGYDIAVLVSQDTDYAEVIELIEKRFNKEVRVGWIRTTVGHHRNSPKTLIDKTRSKQGIEINTVPSYNTAFPVHTFRTGDVVTHMGIYHPHQRSQTCACRIPIQTWPFDPSSTLTFPTCPGCKMRDVAWRLVGIHD
jgi:hypothetical protein